CCNNTLIASESPVLAIPTGIQVERNQQDLVRIETRMDRPQPLNVLHKEARADQRRQGQNNVEDQKPTAEVGVSVNAAGTSLLERCDQLALGSLPCWNQAKNDSRNQRQQEGKA